MGGKSTRGRVEKGGVGKCVLAVAQGGVALVVKDAVGQCRKLKKVPNGVVGPPEDWVDPHERGIAARGVGVSVSRLGKCGTESLLRKLSKGTLGGGMEKLK